MIAGAENPARPVATAQVSGSAVIDTQIDGAIAASSRNDARDLAVAVRQWPLTVKLYVLALILLYIPVLKEALHAWLTNEDYAHGVFILPVAAALLWMQREAIRKAKYRPTAWGLVPLCLGLLIEVGGYLTSVGFLAIISLVPVLAGTLLALHGRELWRTARFAVCFLAFASTVPGSLTAKPSQWIQGASTTGAVAILKPLGVPLIQTGNIIEIPGMQLEVAQACSGFKKLTALIAFGALYGFIFKVGWGKRMLLICAAVPIALVANSIRVAGLILVSNMGGERALHMAHDWAELIVLVLAFGLFVLFGKMIGCRTLRYSL